MNTKNFVLEQLEKNRGKNISGQELARLLGVSRTAIWKAVNELKKDGHLIETAPRKGYMLSCDANILSVQGITPYLHHAESARRISIFKSVDSTNQVAKKIALDSAAHGTIIIAESQTAGKGRLGRSFCSPEGIGVYMSFVMSPTFLPTQSSTIITTAAAVAVCRAICAATGKETLIKWVNDIFLDGKKVCGILTEAVTNFENGAVEWIVLGIGVNFSTQPKDLPPELRDIVGSVCPGSKDGAVRNRLAAEIINQVLRMDELLKNGDFGDFIEEYKSRSMILGEKITVILPNETYEAVALDINQEGHLIVRKNDGENVTLQAGEVSIRR